MDSLVAPATDTAMNAIKSASPTATTDASTLNVAESQPPQLEPIGIINLPSLKNIQETLQQSSTKEDTDLASWIQRTYLEQSIQPYEEGRGIYTQSAFFQLFQAYQRAQSLSNRTSPEKWPFFNTKWKEMPQAMVRQKAKAPQSLEGVNVGERQSESAEALGTATDQDMTIFDVDGSAGIVSNAVTSGEASEDEIAANSSSGSTGTPLAALSDPIITNLDARPPSAYGGKRKSSTEEEPKKKTKRNSKVPGRGRGRGRGVGRGASRGGHRGGQAASQPSEEMTPASSILGSPSIEATGGVKSGRRKSARLAPALIPAPDLPKADSIKAGISDDSSASLAVEHSNTPYMSIPPEAKHPLADITKDFAKHGEENILQQPANGATRTTSMPAPTPASGVEFFARVHTTTGTLDVKLPQDSFIGEADVVKRYAQWKQQEDGMNLNFEQFKKIFGFAKNS